MRLLKIEPEADSPHSLSAFLEQVQDALEYHFPDQYWIVAEVGQISRNRHCYLTLTESDGSEVVAQVKATIWYGQMRMVQEFEEQTGQRLQAGLKLLLRAKVSFHQQYGLSLQITELDANFTLGELALRRKQIFARLQREGLVDRNKQHRLPLLIQRIAVISSPTAAGFEDFINQLASSGSGHQTYIKLFPAVMQGENAESSVSLSLRKIAQVREHFDVIVIIRGGGSSLDLECFNTYGIARAIALSPLPVLSGIGHQRDESLADVVAFAAHKTPTAVAEFIIAHLFNYEATVEDFAHQISSYALQHLSNRQKKITDLQNRFERHTRSRLQLAKDTLNKAHSQLQSKSCLITAKHRELLATRILHLKYATEARLQQGKNALDKAGVLIQSLPITQLPAKQRQLDQLEELVQAYDPQRLLKRGYSITFSEGTVVKNKAQLEPGALLYTQFADGGTVSEVIEGKPKKKSTTRKSKAPNGHQLQIDL